MHGILFPVFAIAGRKESEMRKIAMRCKCGFMCHMTWVSLLACWRREEGLKRNA
jgi:hypothetical protein